MWTAFAWLMAATHVSLIVLLIIGAPLAVRWPRLVPIHLAAAFATAAVFLVGADCPLTVWQKYGIRRAGGTPYEGGFIEHYLLGPSTGESMTPTASIIIVLAWTVPTTAGYLILSRRRAGTR